MSIQRDVLFVGATRPSMIAGVTYEALGVEVFITGIANTMTGHPATLLLFPVLHLISYILCMKDPRQFKVLFMYFGTKGRCKNKAFWKASSVAPYEKRRY
jgi:type IV secretion system protein VirB3